MRPVHLTKNKTETLLPQTGILSDHPRHQIRIKLCMGAVFG